MKLIVWLGNPWKEYSNNRHNIWFILIDQFCEKNNIWPWKSEKSFHAEIIKDGDVIFCKPQTYMNKSGESVKKVADYYKILPENIIVLYDEIDLPTGKIQKKIGWSSAGHNWIKSILQHLENNNTFTKIRVWVDRPSTRDEVVDWVLWDFSKSELTEIDNQQDVIFWYISGFIEE